MSYSKTTQTPKWRMKVSSTNRECHTPSFFSLYSLYNFHAHSFSVCVRRLTYNPYVKRFVRGAARSRVTFKENLVEEFGEKKTGEDDVSVASSSYMPLSPASVLALLAGGGGSLSSWTSSKSSDGLQSPSASLFRFQSSPTHISRDALWIQTDPLALHASR